MMYLKHWTVFQKEHNNNDHHFNSQLKLQIGYLTTQF